MSISVDDSGIVVSEGGGARAVPKVDFVGKSSENALSVTPKPMIL